MNQPQMNTDGHGLNRNRKRRGRKDRIGARSWKNRKIEEITVLNLMICPSLVLRLCCFPTPPVKNGTDLEKGGKEQYE